MLVVAARISVGDGGEFGAEYGDGVLTRLGTFQKLYTQAELREYLQGVLETEAVPAAPGVFYVFKDDELSQRYFAARYRRRGVTPRQRISERRFEEHRPLLEPLMAKVAELGRLPFPDELPESQAVIAAFGSLKRAFALIRRVTGNEEWEPLRQERIDDLTVYLALARFRKRPPISSLPLDLQRDIREFFGSYTRACEAADAWLFQAGDPCRAPASINAVADGQGGLPACTSGGTAWSRQHRCRSPVRRVVRQALNVEKVQLSSPEHPVQDIFSTTRFVDFASGAGDNARPSSVPGGQQR